tara:strand:+ start:1259 stop:3238 length:1980 start_codon:yes stop_codon:yes gene_type:complete
MSNSFVFINDNNELHKLNMNVTSNQNNLTFNNNFIINDPQTTVRSTLSLIKKTISGGSKCPSILFQGELSNTIWKQSEIYSTDISGYGGSLTFSTKPTTNGIDGEPIDRMVINQDGNVGIGTSNVTEKLHIDGNLKVENGNVLLDQGNIDVYGDIKLASYPNNFDDNNRKIYWASNSGTTTTAYIHYKGGPESLEIGSNGDDGNIKFFTATSADVRMEVDKYGKIDIKQKLQTGGPVIIGGQFVDHATNLASVANPYNGVAQTRLFFGGLQENPYYHIGTDITDETANTLGNIGNFTRLSLRWHTGIRIGAHSSYGGVRFYNNDDVSDASLCVSIGCKNDNTILHKGNIKLNNGFIEIVRNPSGSVRDVGPVYSHTILKATVTNFGYEQRIIQRTDPSNSSYHRAALIMMYGGSTQGIVNLSRYGYSGGYNEGGSHVTWDTAGYTALAQYTGYSTSNPADGDHYEAALMNFTGQHRCVTNNMDIDNIENYTGLIVCASGKYNTYNMNLMKQTTGKDGITICDALPIINFTTKKKQKNVFGVLAYKEESERRFCVGNFHTPYPNDNDDKRVYVNSVGEGGIIIVNTNGNLENGDYIQSSDVFGYGEKQDDDILHNYTVAKITCDCDFTLNSDDYACIEFVDSTSGNTYRKAFVGCTYHCG